MSLKSSEMSLDLWSYFPFFHKMDLSPLVVLSQRDGAVNLMLNFAFTLQKITVFYLMTFAEQIFTLISFTDHKNQYAERKTSTLHFNTP